MLGALGRSLSELHSRLNSKKAGERVVYQVICAYSGCMLDVVAPSFRNSCRCSARVRPQKTTSYDHLHPDPWQDPKKQNPQFWTLMALRCRFWNSRWIYYFLDIYIYISICMDPILYTYYENPEMVLVLNIYI